MAMLVLCKAWSRLQATKARHARPADSCHPGSRAAARLLASWWRLHAASQADALGHLGTLPRVARRRHGVVGLEPELLAVRLRRELVRDVEMAPKDSLVLAADQADQVIVPDRAAHRDGGLRSGWLSLLSTESIESTADRTEQIAQIGRGNGVPGHVGDHDLRREPRERPRLLLFLFFGMLRHGCASA